MERGECREGLIEQLYKDMYPALHACAMRILEDASLAESAAADS